MTPEQARALFFDQLGPNDALARRYGEKAAVAAILAAVEPLVEALTELADVFAHDDENSVERFDRLAAMFRKDTGYMAPGKDQPASGIVLQADRDSLNAIYDAWYLAKVTRARAALAAATPSQNTETGR